MHRVGETQACPLPRRGKVKLGRRALGWLDVLADRMETRHPKKVDLTVAHFWDLAAAAWILHTMGKFPLLLLGREGFGWRRNSTLRAQSAKP